MNEDNQFLEWLNNGYTIINPDQQCEFRLNDDMCSHCNHVFELDDERYPYNECERCWSLRFE